MPRNEVPFYKYGYLRIGKLPEGGDSSDWSHWAFLTGSPGCDVRNSKAIPANDGTPVVDGSKPRGHRFRPS